MTSPTSTYRLQLHADFTFDNATAIVGYLAELGVSHLFCSPILQAVPGSRHGYDVVDHSRVSDDLGGEVGFRRFAQAAREHGLGIVVDVVPNHMAVPTPMWLNRALWEGLREGPDSPYARWFDVDLSQSQGILMPILGQRIGQELEAGNLSVQRCEIPGYGLTDVVVYFDHVFPVRPGTEQLPLAELLEAQWYRLAYWKIGSEEINYRRFFDVATLAAIRVEDPEVFQATHAKLLELHTEGLIDGFRIDHPDGLANPRGYLADLQRATGGCWVAAEKILEADEKLPESFECAGTTGYDALARVAGLFHDPGAVTRINALWERLSGEGTSFHSELMAAKREIVTGMLFAEVDRLTALAVGITDGDIRLRDHPRRQLYHAIRELLQAMDRYRAYVEPGVTAPPQEREVILEAAERARAQLPEEEQESLDVVVALACGDLEANSTPELRAEFMIRFAQTCGPVMAKSKEDTAFYRWNRFLGVNEVGSEPTPVGVTPDDFHDFCEQLSNQWPTTMTTLSTHDTKRSEDVRARLSALLEHAKEWESCVAELRAATEEIRSEQLDGATEALLWQTLAATWRLPDTLAGQSPISPERLSEYLTKAMREAKRHTSWTQPNEAYELGVLETAEALLNDARVGELLDDFTELIQPSVRTTVLGQKLLQLAMPGVPDVYQGCELIDLSLVDPDNRRPVDFAARSKLLAEASGPVLDTEKILVTSRVLQFRGQHPDAFCGPQAEYRPVPTTTGHAVAFSRSVSEAEKVTAIAVATRLQRQLSERDGWGEHSVILPAGDFQDLLTGRTLTGGETLLADLLDEFPVAFLVPAACAEH